MLGGKGKCGQCKVYNRAVVFFLSFQGKNKEQPKDREKEKETKEPKERWKELNRHQLVPGVFSSCTSCSLCAKPLVNKSALQCLSEYGSGPAWLQPAPQPPPWPWHSPAESNLLGLLHFSAGLAVPATPLGPVLSPDNLNELEILPGNSSPSFALATAPFPAPFPQGGFQVNFSFNNSYFPPPRKVLLCPSKYPCCLREAGAFRLVFTAAGISQLSIWPMHGRRDL